ncbi:MAG: hypothetical protein AAFV86_04085 [Pseudomonadota bacterium]
MRLSLATMALLATSAGAEADADFGTPEEARIMAEKIIAIIDENGIEAGVKSLFDPDLPFGSSPMGINLFEGSVVVGDNREPEMVASEFAETPDLTGVAAWPRIDAAAGEGRDVVLKWYHYDTQEVYDFHCYSLRAASPEYTVMVCR